MGIILILAGIITAALAYSDADWYFNTGRARMWSALFGGRENARVALIVVGIILIVVGLVVPMR